MKLSTRGLYARISVPFQVSHEPIWQDFTWGEDMSEYLCHNKVVVVYETLKLQQPQAPYIWGLRGSRLLLHSLRGKLGHLGIESPIKISHQWQK